MIDIKYNTPNIGRQRAGFFLRNQRLQDISLTLNLLNIFGMECPIHAIEIKWK
jgi:hypothetical protein